MLLIVRFLFPLLLMLLLIFAAAIPCEACCNVPLSCTKQQQLLLAATLLLASTATRMLVRAQTAASAAALAMHRNLYDPAPDSSILLPLRQESLPQLRKAPLLTLTSCDEGLAASQSKPCQSDAASVSASAVQPSRRTCGLKAGRPFLRGIMVAETWIETCRATWTGGWGLSFD